MLKTLSDAWKIPEIRKKMLYTAFMLFIFRLGSAIPVPYMDKGIIKGIFEATEGSILSFLDMMAGGTFSDFSIFATNIYPYITASIVVQLLAIAIPTIESWAEEGDSGKKKMSRLTKGIALALALVQAIGFTLGVFGDALLAQTTIQKIIVVMTLVSGTFFLVWIGERITEKGIGNGTSLIIFVGIVSRLPAQALNAIRLIKAGQLNIFAAIAFVILAIIIIAAVVALQEGERRVPVQYAKRVVGRKMYGGQSTHIPIKVSMAGVMPVIFTSSILALPQTISLIAKGGVSDWIVKWLTPQGSIGIWVYSILNILLIMFFSYFYTAIQFNTVEYSKNLQQNGGFIPGIRPGRPTSEHLDKIVSRLTFVGGLSLAILASLPTLLSKLFGMNISFGGTAIIIVVGTALETVRELESQMLMRHYSGFLN